MRNVMHEAKSKSEPMSQPITTGFQWAAYGTGAAERVCLGSTPYNISEYAYALDSEAYYM